MSEEIKPEVPQTSDVPQTEELSLADKTLAQLSEMFSELAVAEDRLKRSKEAEAIKSAFYKLLSKEKAEAGLGAAVDEPSEDAPAETPEGSAEGSVEGSAEAPVEEAPAEDSSEPVTSPFAAIEEGFKAIYTKYRKERAEYNRQLESEREQNLVLKKAVIEDLKSLVEKQEDVNATFPEFRELQNRWREIGPVPVQNYREINDTYQFNVERFYDMVKINRELRDLDFKKNLEAKEEFCRLAEKLAESDNVVEAFRELQKLHDQWKEYGPVAKEYRESIWDRFKAATAIVNKNYQAYFEGLKAKQAENLKAKSALCEKVEEIADKEITTSNEWNALSKAIEDIQADWRKIGFASKKENQRIYDRFRAACDKFFERKRVFYSQFKDNMNENLEKKLALIEQAEAIKNSTDWKKTTDQFINLQKQWKEIGAVPRKKSEQLWKRFRAACDEFFAERDKNAKPENDFYSNLKAKRNLIEDIKAFDVAACENAAAAAADFSAKWQAIGHVPFKEKDAVNAAYREAMQGKFPDFSTRSGRGPRDSKSKPKTEKERLVAKYNQLQQDIVTYENNIGFFSKSTASALLDQMQEKIDAAKAELKTLAAEIRKIEDAENETK